MKTSRNTVEAPELRNARGTGLLWALLLVCGSLLLLIYNLNLLRRFEPLSDYILAGVLALGGVALFASLILQRQAWWRVIPAWTLVALGAMVLLGRAGGGRWVAALLFGGLALAFLNIWMLNRRDQWWALLPGGFLAVLGLVVGLSSSVDRLEVLGAVLFGGLGLVFLLVGVAGGPQSRYWAQIPGSILVLFGFFVLTAGTSGSDGGRPGWVAWWPILSLAAGLLVAWRAVTVRPAEPRFEVNRAPAARRDNARTDPPPPRQALGEYNGPAPGASVQILTDDET